jgi:hypothetical protein
MDITFQYPPDLFNLLVDTLPRLCRSKRDVILFLRGAGLERPVYADLEQQVNSDPASITKFDIVRTVLTRLNARGEAALRERREVLKRVTEFEEFETCWDNDRLQAKGLVAEVRKLIDVKDSFTRMRIERDRERRERQQEIEKQQRVEAQRRGNVRAVRDEFFKLFAEQDRHKQGKLLEGALNRLFAAYGLSVREAFVLRGAEGEGIIEQIDGVIELDGEIYLVEVKWWGDPLGPGEISQHLVRVYHRGHARGIFISHSGYTVASVNICAEALQRTVVVLCELSEFVHLLERELPLQAFLKAKVQAAVIEKKPLHRPLS